MKEFINKVLSNQQITINELTSFIAVYSDLCGLKDTTSDHINYAVQLINIGQFDLRYACKNYAKLKNIEIDELKDINGELIKVYVK